jgi:hypothetical protein
MYIANYPEDVNYLILIFIILRWCIYIDYIINTVEPLITDTLINEHLQ